MLFWTFGGYSLPTESTDAGAVGRPLSLQNCFRQFNLPLFCGRLDDVIDGGWSELTFGAVGNKRMLLLKIQLLCILFYGGTYH